MTATTAECRTRTVEEILAAHIPLPRFDGSGSGYVTCPQCGPLQCGVCLARSGIAFAENWPEQRQALRSERGGLGRANTSEAGIPMRARDWGIRSPHHSPERR